MEKHVLWRHVPPKLSYTGAVRGWHGMRGNHGTTWNNVGQKLEKQWKNPRGSRFTNQPIDRRCHQVFLKEVTLQQTIPKMDPWDAWWVGVSLTLLTMRTMTTTTTTMMMVK